MQMLLMILVASMPDSENHNFFSERGGAYIAPGQNWAWRRYAFLIGQSIIPRLMLYQHHMETGFRQWTATPTINREQGAAHDS